MKKTMMGAAKAAFALSVTGLMALPASAMPLPSVQDHGMLLSIASGGWASRVEGHTRTYGPSYQDGFGGGYDYPSDRYPGADRRYGGYGYEQAPAIPPYVGYDAY